MFIKSQPSFQNVFIKAYVGHIGLWYYEPLALINANRLVVLPAYALTGPTDYAASRQS